MPLTNCWLVAFKKSINTFHMFHWAGTLETVTSQVSQEHRTHSTLHTSSSSSRRRLIPAMAANSSRCLGLLNRVATPPMAAGSPSTHIISNSNWVLVEVVEHRHHLHPLHHPINTTSKGQFPFRCTSMNR